VKLTNDQNPKSPAFIVENEEMFLGVPRKNTSPKSAFVSNLSK
jgi:hypothetical protein